MLVEKLVINVILFLINLFTRSYGIISFIVLHETVLISALLTYTKLCVNKLSYFLITFLLTSGYHDNIETLCIFDMFYSFTMVTIPEMVACIAHN